MRHEIARIGCESVRFNPRIMPKAGELKPLHSPSPLKHLQLHACVANHISLLTFTRLILWFIIDVHFSD